MSGQPRTSPGCSCDYGFDFSNRESARRSSIAAEQIMKAGVCDHTCGADLLPLDSKVYAIYCSNCFDPTHNDLRCQKDSTQTLLLGAWRTPSASKLTLRTGIVVETTPARSLQIVDGFVKRGTYYFEAGSEILFPYYKTLGSTWEKRISIRALPSQTPSPASIDVTLSVRRESQKTTTTPLCIQVIVPPAPETEVPLTDSMTSMIVIESIKLLVPEGWSFLKRQFGGEVDSGLIQLNIGALNVKPSDSSDSITRTVKEAKLAISDGDTAHLRGLNISLKNLNIKRSAYLSHKDRGSTSRDNAETDAGLEILNGEIDAVKEQIWSKLKETGQFSVESVTKEEH
jgi:hypothetical protein